LLGDAAASLAFPAPTALALSLKRLQLLYCYLNCINIIIALLLIFFVTLVLRKNCANTHIYACIDALSLSRKKHNRYELLYPVLLVSAYN